MFNSAIAKGLPDRLKKVRGRISRNEFAESLGVHRNTLARYESGESDPNVSLLYDICKKYDVSSVWLFLNVGPMSASQMNNEYIDIMRKARSIQPIDPQQIAMWTELMKSQDQDKGSTEDDSMQQVPSNDSLQIDYTKIDRSLLAKIIELVEFKLSEQVISSTKRAKIISVVYDNAALSGFIDELMIDELIALAV